MTLANGQTPAFPPAVAAAIDAIVGELRLKAAGRAALETAVADLANGRPKLPHVSFYAARTRAGGINYRITYRVPGHPLRTERLGKMPGPAYKRAARVSEILQQVKARLMSAADAHRELYVDNTPIMAHLADFEKSLRSGGATEMYIASTMTRLRRCCELAGYDRLRDITRASLPGLIDRLAGFTDPKSRRKLSASTINQYLASLRQLTRWATPTRLSADPLINSTGVRNTTRAKRRDVLPEELAAIVAAARADKPFVGITGADRAMLYLLAYGTGLRRGEIRATQRSWLRLDAQPPAVTLPARVTKNRKDATQPLPSWLAMELKTWLAERDGAERNPAALFPRLGLKTAKAFDHDRERARRDWLEAATTPAERDEREQSEFLRRQTDAGELVFHSLRHAYASQLVASGMDVKTVQMLTRHSTVTLLGDRYAHARLNKAAEGMERGIRNPLAAEQHPTQAPAQGAAHLDRK